MTDPRLLHAAGVLAMHGPVTDPPPQVLEVLDAARRAGLVRVDRAGGWVVSAKGARALRAAAEAPPSAQPRTPRPDRALDVLNNARARSDG